MTKRTFSSRGKIITFTILVVMICVFVVAAVRQVDVSFVDNPITLSTPTRDSFSSMVELAKPTYTFTPLPTQTATIVPTIELTATIEALAQAEIVLDTAIPAEVVSVDQNYVAQPSYGGNKYILVDISEQHMYVYEGDVMIYSFVASTGINNGTRVGSFSVLDKIPNAYGATWDLWMPNWLGIYWSGSLENGIHALPILSNGAQLWAGYLGTPISFGCVVLGVYESQLLYDWAEVGTPVDIQW